MTQQKTQQIVVGFDFSELAERAFAEALALAGAHPGAELHVVTVADDAGTGLCLPGQAEPLADEAAQEVVRRRVDELIDQYRSRGGVVTLERVAIYVLSNIGVAEPGKLLSRLAESVDADLIVVGTHGRRGLSRLLMGSVAQQVVREATCSVHVVRPPDMIGGKTVPSIEPPLGPGEHALHPFEHRRTYHYVDKVSRWTSRTLPVS